MDKRPDLLEEEQVLSLFWGRLVKFGPALVVAVFYVSVVLHYTYTPDDTYIYLQYAKNLATGNGFSFNPNMPSYGVTGPLWVLFIAGGVKAGLDPFVVAKTFGLLFSSLSIVLVYALAFTIIRDKIFAFFAAIVFSLDAWFLRWAGSGMETSLAVVLVLLTVKHAYLGEYHIAGFVAGLLTLVRPEGFLLFCVIQIENYLMSYVVEKSRRLFWISALLYLLVVVPWLVFSYSSFGSIVPNAGFAKSATHRSLADAVGAILDSAQILGSTLPVLLILIVIGVPMVIRKGGIGTFIAKGMPILWIVGVPLGYAILNVQVVSRYLVPIVPLIVIYAFWCLKEIELRFGWSSRRGIMVLTMVALATILQSQVVYQIRVVPHMKAFAKGMEEGIKPIALWLKSNADDSAVVLTPDVGMMGYIAEKRFYDTAGLITPAVKAAFDGMSYDEGMQRNVYRTVVRPNYVVDRGPTVSRLASDSLRPILSKEFPGLGLRKPEVVYYTLYEVTR